MPRRYLDDPDRPRTIDELADEFDTTPKTLAQWIARGDLGVKPRTDPETGTLTVSAADAVTLRRFKLRKDIRSLFRHARQWLETPNPRMGGAAPNDLIGTDQEDLVFDVVESMKHGMVS